MTKLRHQAAIKVKVKGAKVHKAKVMKANVLGKGILKVRDFIIRV